MRSSIFFQRHRELTSSSNSIVQHHNIMVMDTGCKRTLTTFAIGQKIEQDHINSIGMETEKGSLEICRQEQMERLMELSVCSDDEGVDKVFVPSFSSSMSSGEVSRRIRAINLDIMENRMPCNTSEVDSVLSGMEADQNPEENPSWIRRLLHRFKISCFN